MSTGNNTAEQPETAKCDCDKKRPNDMLKTVSIWISTAMVSWGNTFRLLLMLATFALVGLVILWVLSTLGETTAVVQLVAGAGVGGTVTAIASRNRQ
jgi:hypothetical protein